jgi:hypothetical protein
MWRLIYHYSEIKILICFLFPDGVRLREERRRDGPVPPGANAIKLFLFMTAGPVK